MAHEGLLRHHSEGAGRVRARRRRDAGPGLLGRGAAACGSGARRDRAAVVRVHAERVRDRERHPRDAEEVHAPRRTLAVHRPGLFGALGPIRGWGSDRCDSRRAALRVSAALHRSRPDPGRCKGMSVAEVTTALLDEPHHDGSELYVLEQPDARGGEAVVRARVPLDVDTVAVRWVEDGEGRAARAEQDGDGWWIARFPVNRSVMHYRWLLAGGEVGYAWLNGAGVVTHDVPDADDFVLSLDAGPAWHLESVVYEIFPDRFATSGLDVEPPSWAVRRDWNELPEGRSPNTPYEWFGG